MTRSTRGLTLIIATAIAVANLGIAAELIGHDFVRGSVRANYLTISVAIPLAALAVGVAAVFRRPSAVAGWLLAAGAATTGFSYWRFSSHPWLASFGLLV